MGEVAEAVTGDSGGAGAAPAAVASLAFDGMHIAVGTHEGYVHSWQGPVSSTSFYMSVKTSVNTSVNTSAPTFTS